MVLHEAASIPGTNLTKDLLWTECAVKVWSVTWDDRSHCAHTKLLQELTTTNSAADRNFKWQKHELRNGSSTHTHKTSFTYWTALLWQKVFSCNNDSFSHPDLWVDGQLCLKRTVWELKAFSSGQLWTQNSYLFGCLLCSLHWRTDQCSSFSWTPCLRFHTRSWDWQRKTNLFYQ